MNLHLSKFTYLQVVLFSTAMANAALYGGSIPWFCAGVNFGLLVHHLYMDVLP